MGASRKIKKILIDKGLTQQEFAESMRKDPQQVRNALARDSFNYKIMEEWLKALGCEIVFRDKETGRLYD